MHTRTCRPTPLRYIGEIIQPAGRSSSSANLTRYTLANPPANVVSTGTSQTTVGITWNSNNNGSSTRYIIWRATSPANDFVNYYQLSADTVLNTFTSTGLAEGATYTYRIAARNGDNTDSSLVYSTAASLNVKPGAINTLSASLGAVEGTVILRWIAPGDDGSIGNITNGQYDIRWSSRFIHGL